MGQRKSGGMKKWQDLYNVPFGFALNWESETREISQTLRNYMF